VNGGNVVLGRMILLAKCRVLTLGFCLSVPPTFAHPSLRVGVKRRMSESGGHGYGMWPKVR